MGRLRADGVLEFPGLSAGEGPRVSHRARGDRGGAGAAPRRPGQRGCGPGGHPRQPATGGVRRPSLWRTGHRPSGHTHRRRADSTASRSSRRCTTSSTATPRDSRARIRRSTIGSGSTPTDHRAHPGGGDPRGRGQHGPAHPRPEAAAGAQDRRRHRPAAPAHRPQGRPLPGRGLLGGGAGPAAHAAGAVPSPARRLADAGPRTRSTGFARSRSMSSSSTRSASTSPRWTTASETPGEAGAARAPRRALIGGVRPLPLLEMFHTTVQLHRASDEVRREALKRAAREHLASDKDLCIDPEFFRAVRERVPALSQVWMQLKGGRHRNELTRFKYDVLFEVNGPREAPLEVEWLDWQERRLTLAEVSARLAREAPAALSLANVPNARLSRERQAMTLLAAPGGPATVGELRRTLSALPPAPAEDPEDFRRPRRSWATTWSSIGPAMAGTVRSTPSSIAARASASRWPVRRPPGATRSTRAEASTATIRSGNSPGARSSPRCVTSSRSSCRPTWSRRRSSSWTPCRSTPMARWTARHSRPRSRPGRGLTMALSRRATRWRSAWRPSGPRCSGWSASASRTTSSIWAETRS